MTAPQSETRRGPTLQQGCAISAGIFVLALGGCLVGGLFEFGGLSGISLIVGNLSGWMGLILLIAWFDRWLKRK